MFRATWLNQAQVRELYAQALEQTEQKRLLAHINAVIDPSDETITAEERYDAIIDRLKADYDETMQWFGSKDASVDAPAISTEDAEAA